jgi:hypothetical protein
MATTLINPAAGFATYALQARTDAAGADVDDVTGEDLRLMASLFEAGVVGADSFRVTQRGAGANMSVDVGSGAAASDLAVVEGTVAGQGNYVVRLGDAVTNVPLNASNVSNPRIDQIFLVVQDDQYDSSDRVLARLAYRDGTPASSPVAPGPDGAWDAYLLLANVLVGAGVTSVTNANITDQRTGASAPAHAVSHGRLGADRLIVMDTVTEDISAPVAIGTSFAARASVTFTKPAAWITFDIVAWGATSSAYSGTDSATVGVDLAIGSSEGTEVFATWGVASNEPTQPFSMAVSHKLTGVSDSSLAVRVRSRRFGAATVSATSATVSFIATRTS